MSAVQGNFKNKVIVRKRQAATKDIPYQNESSSQGEVAKVIIRSSKDNQSRVFVLSERPGETTEIVLPKAHLFTSDPSEPGCKKIKRPQRIGVPIIKDGVEVNPSLERGLKILAAAVPEAEKTLFSETIIEPELPTDLPLNIGARSKNGLVIKRIVNSAEQLNVTPTPQQSTTYALPEVNRIQVQQGIPNITTPLFNSVSTIPVSINTIPNYVNTDGHVVFASAPSVPLNGQNPNLIYSSTSPNILYTLASATTPSLIIKRPIVDNLPKISAVHSQFRPETLTEIKITKCELICKDIEDNPSLYLGIGKKEMRILQLVSNVCQLTRKQIFVIIRKMRHNEPADILADLFEISMEEVVQIIIDNVPKIAHLFRKLLKIASRNSSEYCIIDQIQISVHKASYLTEQPEEVSRYSSKVDLKYLISCTHSGLINFVSKGYEVRSRYSKICHLFHFINFVNPMTVYIGDGLQNIDGEYLRTKNLNVHKAASICYRMNIVRAFDGIKLFKILSNTEVPLRYEVFNIIDDILMLACALYNFKLM